ncbi:hypothetical protein AB0K48_46715, partial [Nonomuraea sp. NPDC055795]
SKKAAIQAPACSGVVSVRAGAIEVAASALAIEHQIVPPTANLHHPDPECDLDYVPLTARDHRTDVVLSVGSGFGGFQTAMVLAKHEKGDS